jgi:hypothetical protein
LQVKREYLEGGRELDNTKGSKYTPWGGTSVDVYLINIDLIFL